jgi:naphthoate synthase
MSKPIKREPGSRTIPDWKIGAGTENFTDVRYEIAEDNN